MTDRRRPPLDPAAQPPAQGRRLENTSNGQGVDRARHHEPPTREAGAEDAEDSDEHVAPSSVTSSELDMRKKSHWENVKPASADVVRNVMIGSLISAPVMQFAKDPDGKQKRKHGFFKSPLGMMLIKMYPLVVHDVDRDENGLPKKLYCMQRHTYGGNGLQRGGRLREDYHLHVKLVPPGGDEHDRGDAPNDDPLIIQRMYNRKPISENAYLEFRSIFVVELDEHVKLDGHLETRSWVHLFKLHISTVSRTALRQVAINPSFRKQIRDAFVDCARSLENEAGVADATSTGPTQRAASDNALPRIRTLPGGRSEETASRAGIIQNHHLWARDSGVYSYNQQNVEAPRRRKRPVEETRRRRSRSPRAAEPEQYRGHDDTSGYRSQSRNYRSRPQDYNADRARRRERESPESCNDETCHTLDGSWCGRRTRRSGRDTDLMSRNGPQPDCGYYRSDDRYDQWNGREQGHSDNMIMRRRGRGANRSEGRRRDGGGRAS